MKENMELIFVGIAIAIVIFMSLVVYGIIKVP